jgi:cytochrome P450
MSELTRPTHPDVSLSSAAFWLGAPPTREPAYAILRSECPVSWQKAPENSLAEPGGATGYWAVVRHEDIVTISRDNANFCSGQGVQLDDVPLEIQQRFVSFLAMDPPHHTQLRRVVSHAFTPRRVAEMEEAFRKKSSKIVDDLIETGPCDFVENVAYRLPLWTITEMMGLAEHDRDHLAMLANSITGRSDTETEVDSDTASIQSVQSALEELEAVGREMISLRRRSPGEDLISALVQSGSDGEHLSEADAVSIFVVLLLGGFDNTRHTTSHAMRALCDNPDQKTILAREFDRKQKTAIEEMLRWASSTPTMRRTATTDTAIGGVPVAAGEKVVLFYHSGNRDESVFEHPERFDIDRDPNPHVSLGGGGIHHCIGAPLARAQLRSIFRELLERIPDIEVGEPDYAVSDVLTGINSMPCTFSRPN